MVLAQQILAVLLIAFSAVLMMARTGLAGLPEGVAAFTPWAPHLMMIGAVWYIVVRLFVLWRHRR